MQGVNVIALKRQDNERGHLMEVQRADDAHYLGFAQAYVTSTLPGVVKAWYRHHQQVDQIALVKGELLLVLYDARADSSTNGQVLEIPISQTSPLLVQIPTGVWHGFKASGEEAAFLLHLNSEAFNPDAVDEDRLSWNDSSIPYTW